MSGRAGGQQAVGGRGERAGGGGRQRAAWPPHLRSGVDAASCATLLAGAMVGAMAGALTLICSCRPCAAAVEQVVGRGRAEDQGGRVPGPRKEVASV